MGFMRDFAAVTCGVAVGMWIFMITYGAVVIELMMSMGV